MRWLFVLLLATFLLAACGAGQRAETTWETHTLDDDRDETDMPEERMD